MRGGWPLPAPVTRLCLPSRGWIFSFASPPPFFSELCLSFCGRLKFQGRWNGKLMSLSGSECGVSFAWGDKGRMGWSVAHRPCCRHLVLQSVWAVLGVSLMLITAMLHFKGAQTLLTALGREKLWLHPLMRKLCFSRHREIVSVSMNLDENLRIQGQRREARIPHILAHYQMSFVPGIGQKYRSTR